MKKSTTLFSSFLLASLVALMAMMCTAHAADFRPEMMCSVSAFIDEYNTKAESFSLPLLREDSVSTKSGIMDAASINLTPFSVLTMQMNPGRKSATSISIVGAGDGTNRSGAIIIASVVNSIMAISYGISDSELNRVMTELGLFGGFDDGQRRDSIIRGVKYSSTLTSLGFLMGAQPAD